MATEVPALTVTAILAKPVAAPPASKEPVVFLVKGLEDAVEEKAKETEQAPVPALPPRPTLAPGQVMDFKITKKLEPFLTVSRQFHDCRSICCRVST